MVGSLINLFYQRRDDCHAIMAVGVIEGEPEAVFNTLLSVDSLRTE